MELDWDHDDQDNARAGRRRRRLATVAGLVVVAMLVELALPFLAG